MSFLLDTNFVSEWTKPRPNARVVAWLASVDEDRTFLSVVTIAELRTGVERLARGDGCVDRRHRVRARARHRDAQRHALCRRSAGVGHRPVVRMTRGAGVRADADQSQHRGERAPHRPRAFAECRLDPDPERCHYGSVMERTECRTSRSRTFPAKSSTSCAN